MEEILRNGYLEQLLSYRWNGQVKVITGIRRCGKSYLLRRLFINYLLGHGVREEQIISVELDLTRDIRFRNPLELSAYVRGIAEGKKDEYYLFVDEIQMSDETANPYNPAGKKITFYDALNDLRSLPNLDVYVTGSNSKMLSSDILTEFRGRSDEIRVHPLSFSEFLPASGCGRDEAFEQYAFYGGMPFVLSRLNEAAKMNYLKSLFSEVYLKDIVERRKIEREDALGMILDLLCSSVGSLTNPAKITDSLKSRSRVSVSPNTVRAYISHLEDAFLFSESKRYDVKGKSYFDYPSKYYCEDVGLRNARLGFRQQEMTHIMENIIYNELVSRGLSVDVGVVFARTVNDKGSSVRSPREIDFVVNSGGRRVYIQSAYAMETPETAAAEARPFALTRDSFPKIIVRRDTAGRWYDESGVLNINVMDFLLDKNLI